MKRPSSAHVDNGRGCACVGTGEYSKLLFLLCHCEPKTTLKNNVFKKIMDRW